MVKGEKDSTYLKIKERYDKLINTNLGLKTILDLWETTGIEAAMQKYYKGYVKMEKFTVTVSSMHWSELKDEDFEEI